MDKLPEQVKPLVSLEGIGSFEGCNIDGVARFLNVPYASPPVDSHRWKPPEPPLKFSGVRANPVALRRCPQPRRSQVCPEDESRLGITFEGHTLEDSEDCLVLNVFTPANAFVATSSGKSSKQLPTIFYIHGGGGKFGSCHGSHLAGQELVKSQNACYVAANYRLGIFGFLSHPELSAEDMSSEADTLGSGNYALLDLIAALHWIRCHIGSFGGDPNNVTVWGFSTGAQLAGCLLVSPRANGLFHRVFIQSCVDVVNVRAVTPGSSVWLNKSGEEWGQELGEELGCPKGDGQLAAMRRLTAAELVCKTMEKSASDCYEPALDSRECHGKMSARPLLSIAALAIGAFNKVPVMIGVTEQDGLGKSELELVQFPEIDVGTLDGLDSLLANEFGDTEEPKLHYPHYPFARPVSAKAYLEHFLGDLSKDLWYNAATWFVANKIASSAGAPPIFMYVFTEKVSSSGLPWEPDISIFPSSFHGADAVYWNGNVLKPLSEFNDDGRRRRKEALAKQMMTFLANFSRTGNPGHGSDGEAPPSPHWEPHSCGCARYMELGPCLEMRTLDEKTLNRYRFIEAYLEKRLVQIQRAKRRKLL